MSTVEKEIRMLHENAVDSQPEVAVNVCIGCNGHYAKEHHPFVVMKKSTSGGGLWERESVGEFNSLKDALEIPGAKPYGSSAVCSSCSELSIKDVVQFV